MSNENDYYPTSDLALASTLHHLGLSIEALDREYGGKVHFLFKQSKELERAKEAFWKRELIVEPVGFMESVKYIKNRIYSE
jgi:hypothetical protein